MADVAVIMGSLSDWETMKQATHILEEFGIDFDKRSFPLTGHQKL